MFADITTKEITRTGWATDADGDSVFEVQFAVNLTVAEKDAVERRLTTGGQVEEDLQARAVNAYQNLLDYEALATPTNAQTVSPNGSSRENTVHRYRFGREFCRGDAHPCLQEKPKRSPNGDR